MLSWRSSRYLLKVSFVGCQSSGNCNLSRSFKRLLLIQPAPLKPLKAKKRPHVVFLYPCLFTFLAESMGELSAKQISVRSKSQLAYTWCPRIRSLGSSSLQFSLPLSINTCSSFASLNEKQNSLKCLFLYSFQFSGLQ